MVGPDGPYTPEQQLMRCAWAHGWEFEFKGELDDGVQCFELAPQTVDGESYSAWKARLFRIHRDGTVSTGYGDEYREMTIAELKMIISTPPE